MSMIDGINTYEATDALLAAEARRCYWQKWNEENKNAVAEYNTRIEREGLPLAKYRTF